ncbi:hypothetical protein RIF29_15512 [Crotalaria pallida]|uniref:monogalactosyldiacylglycerol synthase n=1 Tax=Crotalaria pallida TaxID=3830 RepID=A0AAN9FJ77_CROPI
MVISSVPPTRRKSSLAENVFIKSRRYNSSSQRQRRCGYETQGMELLQMGAETTKNVLILMSDTGGGHRASAEAIRDAMRFKWNSGISTRWIHSMYLAAIAAYYAKELEAGLMEYKPDIIISVHPLMQHIPLLVLQWQGLLKKVIFATVITDLNTCHGTWFNPRVNRCYCPSQEVAKRALLDGLEESQIRIFGLPIRPSFARMGPVKETAMALGESLLDEKTKKPIGQLVVICGRNNSLASTLQSLEWNILVKIRGFETQMEKWMGSCDCIITKAGPGTIAEALIRGLPIILNDYIPGQEKGNVPYVVNNGAGVFTRSPKETATIVTEWFTTKSYEMKKMSENALMLAQPEAVFDIVKDIHALAQQSQPIVTFPYKLTSSFTTRIN